MRRRSLILVGVLLILFIVPMSFSNVSAIAYEYSPESIEEFYETLPNDVLFYPDAIEPQITDGNVSGAETNTYTATYVNDATTWNNAATGSALYTYFDINGSFPVDTMHLEIDAVGSSPIATNILYLYLYNPQGTDLLVASDNGVGAGVDAVLNGWYNVTAWGYYEYDSKHTFYLYHAGSVNPTTILVDYFRLSFMTGASQADPVLSEPYFATGGDTGFGNTYAVDSDNFTVSGILEFSYDSSNISSLVSFTYAIYGISAGSTFVHYSSDDVDYGSGAFDVITSEGWYNGTYNTALGALENTGIGYVQFFANLGSTVNYMEISFTYIPVSAYGESFSDVSEWQFELESSPNGYSFTTDGDIATLALGYDDASNEAIRYNTTISGISITDYIEYRWITSPSAGLTLSTALTVYLDDIIIGTRAITSDWTTTKLYVGDYCTVAPTTLAIHADDWGNGHATDSGYVKLDYVRIGPADEMGFQHDGSITQGVEAFNGGSISSDGDYLSLISDADGAIFNFTMDNTTTVSAISSVYYPFWEINIHPNDVGNDLQIRVQYADDSWNTVLSQFTTIDSSIRINMRSVSASSIKTFQIWGYLSQTTRIDYVKAYSIANYTITQSGSCSTSDVLYVESGTLIGSKTTGTYIALNHDPILSIDTSQFTHANVSIPANFTWLGGGTYGFAITVTVSGDSDTQYDETQFALDSGTLTDFTIFVNGIGNMSAIKFYGVVPAWNIITTVEILFWVAGWHIIISVIIIFITELSTYTLNLFFLFLGLAMIPLSTIYLVKGGREEMSMDKVFFGIVVFILGWALFLGGIFV